MRCCLTQPLKFEVKIFESISYIALVIEMLKRAAYENTIEVGVDEAGRGCLMGPVVAAAVVLPQDCSNPLWAAVKDSKKLSEKKRATLADMIRTEAYAFGIGIAHADEIDQVNILQATFKAMHRALDNCYNMCREKSQHPFDYILVDGPHFKRYMVPGYDEETMLGYDCIENGDGTYTSIAAASILAKTTRDQWVLDLVAANPVLDERYNFKKNKGYGTKAHMDGLRQHGIVECHRKTFHPVSSFTN